MSNVSRLHLGASSLELLSKTPTAEFIDPTWLHFGDEPDYSARSETGTVKSMSRNLAKGFLRTLRLGPREGDPSLYQQTNFMPWMFNKGDRLPLDDGKISFIYSEHVLEHFRYDIATQLLSEAFRVLKPGGVIRSVVPDSDYRTYEPPEPAGYPGRNLPYTHPNKHKIRWNNYLLAQTLTFIGFKAISVVWCSDDGRFNSFNPADLHDLDVVDREMVATLRYVQRNHSLIVDGVKPALPI
jgi:predicted SAM-dependent methyltransferase